MARVARRASPVDEQDWPVPALDLSQEAAVVPIVAPRGTELTGGSGFLAEVDGETFLVTVAHHATGLNRNPEDWATRTPRVHVPMGPAPAPGAPIPVHSSPIELFDYTEGGTRVPRFRYVRPSWTPGFMTDVILRPLHASWDSAANFSVVHLNGGDGGPTPGQSANAWGYPVDVVTAWPRRTATHGPVVALSGRGPALLLIDMKVNEGFSGAPVFVDDGRFVGMVIGETDDGASHAQILTPGIIRSAASDPGGSLVPGPFQNFLNCRESHLNGRSSEPNRLARETSMTLLGQCAAVDERRRGGWLGTPTNKRPSGVSEKRSRRLMRGTQPSVSKPFPGQNCTLMTAIGRCR